VSSAAVGRCRALQPIGHSSRGPHFVPPAEGRRRDGVFSSPGVFKPAPILAPKTSPGTEEPPSAGPTGGRKDAPAAPARRRDPAPFPAAARERGTRPSPVKVLRNNLYFLGQTDYSPSGRYVTATDSGGASILDHAIFRLRGRR